MDDIKMCTDLPLSVLHLYSYTSHNYVKNLMQTYVYITSSYPSPPAEL